MKSLLVTAMAVMASSSFAADSGYKLSCAGTEPYWSVKVDGSTATYTTPGADAPVVYKNAKTSEAAGMSPGYAFQINAQDLSLSIINAGKEGCSDDQSDATYKYHVIANVNGTVFYGCCR